MVIVGNSDVRSFLDRAVQTGRLAPCYLFVGSEGLGKFRTASWLAQHLLCRDSDAPCGNCSICRRVEEGHHSDVLRLERRPDKKEISVDDTRAFIDDFLISAYEGSYRVGIIPEAQTLSILDQNVLLKTLEEPPQNRVLILITSDSNRLLPTVLSRCQILRFRAVERAELTDFLLERGCEKERADVLAGISQGAPGKALRLNDDLDYWNYRCAVLEKLSSVRGGDCWQAIETARKLEELNNKRGEDTISGLTNLLQIGTSLFRDVLVIAAGGDWAQVVNSDCLEDIAAWGKVLGTAGAAHCLEHLEKADVHLRANVNQRLWLQNLLLRILGEQK